MNTISDAQIVAYVESNIGTFHEKRIAALEKLRLNDLLRRKNPYLFRSKNVTVASDLIQSQLDSYLSSQEETLFGGFVEGLAVYVAELVHGGQKSAATGIDLEFAVGQVRCIVSVKSGPNWANSSQKARMKENFSAAARVIRQGNRTANVIAVNGCCYGRSAQPDQGGYFKYCGQEFWELISGDSDFYQRIIEPLGHNAKERDLDFSNKYGAVVNRLSSEFSYRFCKSDGSIDWPKLVAFSSEKEPAPNEDRAEQHVLSSDDGPMVC